MFSLGSVWELWNMEPLLYSGTDENTIAAVASFNGYFSITFEFGVMAFMYIMIVTLLARS
jgi:hypothetical protein